MAVELYLPTDQVIGGQTDFEITADYLELCALFSTVNTSFTKDLLNATDIAGDDDYADLDEELRERDEIVSGTVRVLEIRRRSLGESYPFLLDDQGDVLNYRVENVTYGHACYVLSLVLSNLNSITPILDGTVVHPDAAEIKILRQYFQYFATAALAAEVNGQAWSFGFPRPDKTSFHTKLKEIWDVLRDGQLQDAIGVPERPKDDQIDVFAARLHKDGLPGFLFAAAQVATGSNWRDKSLKGHLDDVFFKRWFGRQPVTIPLCYHVIPFSRSNTEFFDDCLVLGNVLHRLRLPSRVDEAKELFDRGFPIEAFDLLTAAVDWLGTYRLRGLAA